jgi:hypothetical protein
MVALQCLSDNIQTPLWLQIVIFSANFLASSQGKGDPKK